MKIYCALSSPSGGKLGKKEPTASIDTDFLLFVRPEVEIEPGDTVKVIRLGREYLTEAGLADRAALPQQCAAEAGEGESMSRTEYRFDGSTRWSSSSPA